MSIPISEMVARLTPSKTVLFFGAGSSIPSGAPNTNELVNFLCKTFKIKEKDYNLREVASIVEKISRRDLIHELRHKLGRLKPTGALLNLPLYDWRSIYTTNYDRLIELTYEHHGRTLQVYCSNFDFRVTDIPETMKLFKLHGTIEQDVSDGHQGRIVISEYDYDSSLDYREHLYSSLETVLSGANLLIIGYSLADEHIRSIVDRAIRINNKAYIPATINLLMHSTDENRAGLFEDRGFRVAFGDIDDLFLELERQSKPKIQTRIENDEPLDQSASLRVVTIDVRHEIENRQKNAGAMFQGWPATYADIDAQLTFERSLTTEIVDKLVDDENICCTVLGASGTGKSTLSRQVIVKLLAKSYNCWEHKLDYSLPYRDWRNVARLLNAKSEKGVLFVDNAHRHLFELNNLIDLLVSERLCSLKLILASARNHWNPRVKSPNIFKRGHQYILRNLDNPEIEKLLNLVDTNNDLQSLLEESFQGFSRIEKKRRLTVKCESDTFVCLKSIFATEKFDDIILREYAELDEDLREIYKIVAALENSGVNVHRQLIIRILNISADDIKSILNRLVEIIHEYTINKREGIYGWKGRHPVIMGILTKYKMTNESIYRNLLENVIDNLVPTNNVEIRTIRHLCAFGTGISRFNDKHVRNVLLRKMISVAPGERIPRHRLIRNLVDINEFEKAETEIRLFENDFRIDGPVRRYKVLLKLARAARTEGILEEDRLAILEEARGDAVALVSYNPDDKYMLKTYCEVGIEYFKKTGDTSVYYDALEQLRSAEERIADPDITQYIIRYERNFSVLECERSEDSTESRST